MAVKKPAEAIPSTEEIPVDIAPTEITPKAEPAADPGGFCVYIGPSIRGVIQYGTIYNKTLAETKAFLSTAIEKYPLIANLISTEKTFVEDRIKVKTPGNLLNELSKDLISGLSNEGGNVNG